MELDSESVMPEPEFQANRDYFLVHQRRANAGLFISGLHVDRMGRHVVAISRRLAQADGTFSGVAAGTLRVAYLGDLFDKMDFSPDICRAPA